MQNPSQTAGNRIAAAAQGVPAPGGRLDSEQGLVLPREWIAVVVGDTGCDLPDPGHDAQGSSREINPPGAARADFAARSDRYPAGDRAEV